MTKNMMYPPLKQPESDKGYSHTVITKLCIGNYNYVQVRVLWNVDNCSHEPLADHIPFISTKSNVRKKNLRIGVV